MFLIPEGEVIILWEGFLSSGEVLGKVVLDRKHFSLFVHVIEKRSS